MTDFARRRAAAPSILLVLGGGLAGCQSRPVTPPRAPPAPAISRSLDGDYRGTATRYRADRRTCPPPGLVRFTVADAGFLYSLGRRAQIPVTIAADRSLHGSDGDFEVTGTATDARIRGHLDSAACGYEFGAVRKR